MPLRENIIAYKGNEALIGDVRDRLYKIRKKIAERSECHFSYFTVGLDRLYKIRQKYRCVPNEI